jgi:inorganic pyrophosphatase
MNLKIGDKAPQEVNAFIEIPQGSSVKYELDKESGVLFVDRFLFTAMYYPTNYGFIPDTLGEDGDPLDILVLSKQPVIPGAVIPSRIIGYLEMEDESGIDTKLIAVPPEKIDPEYGVYNDVSELSEATKKIIKHFFDRMKELEPGKWVKTKDFKGKAEALEQVKKGIANANK